MALTITIPGGSVQLSDTRVWVKVNTDTVQGSLYEVLLRVTPETAAHLPGGPFDEGNSPDSDGDAWFNISGLLRRIFVPAFNITAGNACTERADTPYKVALDIGETYIDSSGVRQENWSELTGAQYELLILRGGLSEHRQNIYSQLSSNFYTDYVVGGKWLTELPNPCTIAPDKLAKLWYITPETTQQSLTLEAAYTLEDGTTGTTTVACTINPGSLYEFDVDPVTLALTVAGTNRVTSYSVVLKNGETEVIETFTFNIDYNWYEENFQLLFRNKFSGIDTLWLHGQSEDRFPAEHTIAGRTPETTDNSFSRTRVTAAKNGRRRWAVNVGYKTYDEIMALRGTILSRQMWLIDSGYAVPVNIEESEENMAVKTNNLHDYTLIITEAHENNYM